MASRIKLNINNGFQIYSYSFFWTSTNVYFVNVSIGMSGHG